MTARARHRRPPPATTASPWCATSTSTSTQGEVVALLGPNGAGKTTTLLDHLGPRAHARRDHRRARRVGTAPPARTRSPAAAWPTCPRTASLFFDLTAAENLRLGAGRASADDRPGPRLLPGARAAARPQGRPAVGRRAADAGPRPSADRPAPAADGRRDEPRAWRRSSSSSCSRCCARIADETGAGILVVEQHVHLVLELADRAYVLSHGEPGARRLGCRALGARGDLLESSYLGQSEIVAAEEEQEEIEQGLGASRPLGWGRDTSSALDRAARLTRRHVGHDEVHTSSPTFRSANRPSGVHSPDQNGRESSWTTTTARALDGAARLTGGCPAGIPRPSGLRREKRLARPAERRVVVRARRPAPTQEVQHVRHRGDEGRSGHAARARLGRGRARRRPSPARGVSTIWLRRSTVPWSG